MSREFSLPPIVRDLVAARDRLRDHYGAAGLTFTLDGNLIGDLGEAIAAELFGVRLSVRNGTGIDGHAPDGRSVQVKTTGVRGHPAFTHVDTRADHLLFLAIDVDRLTGEVVYNGPEEIVIRECPQAWTGQHKVQFRRVQTLDATVPEHLRLPRVDLVTALRRPA